MITEILCKFPNVVRGKMGKGNNQKKQSEKELDHAKKLHA